MRTAFKLALSFAVAVCMSLPLTVLAQNQITTGSVAGRSVDAAGRGVVGERVELLAANGLITAVTTNGMGEWSFTGVQPGVYTVRMNVRGRIAGVRVTVAAGQVVSGTMVVVPAATASLQFGALASLASLVPSVGTAMVATATAVANPTETANLSPTILQEILLDLTPAQRVTFAQEIIAAQPANTGSAASAFANAVTQLNTIVSSGGNTVPTFPPPTSVS